MRNMEQVERLIVYLKLGTGSNGYAYGRFQSPNKVILQGRINVGDESAAFGQLQSSARGSPYRICLFSFFGLSFFYVWPVNDPTDQIPLLLLPVLQFSLPNPR